MADSVSSLHNSPVIHIPAITTVTFGGPLKSRFVCWIDQRGSVCHWPYMDVQRRPMSRIFPGDPFIKRVALIDTARVDLHYFHRHDASFL